MKSSLHVNAEHNLPAVFKATMEEAAIVDRPSVANLLVEVSRELIVESLGSTLQSLESLLILPDLKVLINPIRVL